MNILEQFLICVLYLTCAEYPEILLVSISRGQCVSSLAPSLSSPLQNRLVLGAVKLLWRLK